MHHGLEIVCSFNHAVILSRIWDGDTHNARLTSKYYFNWLNKKNLSTQRTSEIEAFFLKNTNVKASSKQSLREQVLSDWMKQEGFTVGENIGNSYTRAQVWNRLKKIDPKLFQAAARAGCKVAATPISFFKKQKICKFVD